MYLHRYAFIHPSCLVAHPACPFSTGSQGPSQKPRTYSVSHPSCKNRAGWALAAACQGLHWVNWGAGAGPWTSAPLWDNDVALGRFATLLHRHSPLSFLWCLFSCCAFHPAFACCVRILGCEMLKSVMVGGQMHVWSNMREYMQLLLYLRKLILLHGEIAKQRMTIDFKDLYTLRDYLIFWKLTAWLDSVCVLWHSAP